MPLNWMTLWRLLEEWRDCRVVAYSGVSISWAVCDCTKAIQREQKQASSILLWRATSRCNQLILTLLSFMQQKRFTRRRQAALHRPARYYNAMMQHTKLAYQTGGRFTLHLIRLLLKEIESWRTRCAKSTREEVRLRPSVLAAWENEEKETFGLKESKGAFAFFGRAPYVYSNADHCVYIKCAWIISMLHHALDCMSRAHDHNISPRHLRPINCWLEKYGRDARPPQIVFFSTHRSFFLFFNNIMWWWCERLTRGGFYFYVSSRSSYKFFVLRRCHPGTHVPIFIAVRWRPF